MTVGEIDLERLIAEAVCVVDMYDQANTGNAVCSLGSRGRLLHNAIRDLREVLNESQQRTILK